MGLPMLSMTETLFGGLVLAFVMFILFRKLSLSSFWSAIFAGILPFFIYLYLVKENWPAGDVLTIHFAVYLANAGVLMVFGDLKDKKQRLHWAPKLLVGFFIFLAILNAVLLSIASHGIPAWISSSVLPSPSQGKVHTGFPGTIPHEKNKSYAQKLESFAQQKQLAWDIKVEGLNQLKQHQANTIKVRLLDKQQQPVSGAQVSLSMMRLANSGDDLNLKLKETGNGQYQAELTLDHEGRWMANLNIDFAGHVFNKKTTVFVDAKR